MAELEYYVGSAGPFFVDDGDDAYTDPGQVVQRRELIRPTGVQYIGFDTTIDPSNYPTAVGYFYWNQIDGTFNANLYNGSKLQLGQETFFYGKASGAIANGELCQFAGVQGDHILIKKVVAAEVIAKPTLLVGIATQDISNGSFGYVTWFGKVNDVYTKTPSNNDSADWLAADILYFNSSTGQLTKTAPAAPNIRIEIAAVIKEQTGTNENGILVVRPSFGLRLMDLDDVNGGALDTSGQFLLWNQTNSYFDPSQDFTIDESSGTPRIKTTRQAAKDLEIDCGSQKTIKLIEPVYVDIDFPIVIRTTGVGIPTLTTIRAGTYGNITAPQWQVNDLNVCESQELIHCWMEGSTVYWHLHLTTNGLDATDRYVRFGLSYGYSDGAGSAWQWADIDSGDLLIPANTTDKTMLIMILGNFTPVNAKIGGHVMALLKRITATGTAPTNDPWIPMLQLHIKCDTLGSRQIGTK